MIAPYRAFARHHLLGPISEREGAHGGEAKPVLGRKFRQRAAVVHKMRARFLRGVAGGRGDLDLGLQHFCHNVVAQLLLGAQQKSLVGAAHRMARLRVEQEVLFFHAE